MEIKLSIIALLFGFTSFSQQDAQLNNTTFNPYLINPAAGGMTDVIQLELTGRTQWYGYNGGPRTMMLSGHSPISFSSKSALSEFNLKDEPFYKHPERSTGNTKHIVGGKFVNDAIGVFSKTSAYGSYAVHLPFSKKYNIGAGLGVGFSNFRINEDRVILYNTTDDMYLSFLGGSGNQNFFDANAGVVFYDENLFVGLSVNQLFNNAATFNSVETTSNYVRHLYGQVKYRMVSGSSIDVEPNALVKYASNSPISADFGLRFIYENKAWLNLQYRTGHAMIFQIGTSLVKNLYLCYGYEQSLGKIRSASSGTHEIQLGLYIGRNRNASKEIKDNHKDAEDLDK